MASCTHASTTVHRLAWPIAIGAGLAFAASTAAAAPETFSSGSDGSDGALDLTGTPPGTVVLFDPASFDPPLDVDGDGIFNFTTITIPADVTLKLTSTTFGGMAAYWLASGDVVIDGTIDISGEDGHDAVSGFIRYSIPGPGGFGGGTGESGLLPQTAGLGPGGGRIVGILAASTSYSGTGGSYAQSGRSSSAYNNSSPTYQLNGKTYGNPFLQPLLGGSGGSGGGDAQFTQKGGGGCAGGGAILIASTTRINVNGLIDASGGKGGTKPADDNTSYDDIGGGGSGGAIRFIAPSVGGSGLLTAAGGDGEAPFPGGAGSGGQGYIRIETRTIGSELNTVTNALVVPLGPNTPILPADVPSAVRIVSIDGQPVDATPGGTLLNPDITLNTAAPVQVQFAAKGIPVGTVLKVSIFSAELGEKTVTTSALTGTLDNSTATATVQFPPTISQMFVRATWTP